MGSTSNIQDLTVKGESIERVYGNYVDHRYLVNRRYQRKLIWTLPEKVAFIDSMLRGYPVPIVLLAENRNREHNAFEIIDGMQRLNAVMSFIENEFSVDGAYFDLNSMAVTKAALDAGTLVQRGPVMDRGRCVKVAGYLLPLSIYEFADAGSVDDVFRRINSGGRKLSKQELRAAGATGQFALAVRRIAAKVRGDDSASDLLRLNDMKRISITNRDLPYGIPVDSLFWVTEGILTKEQLRESRDEELIADVVAFMVSEQPPSSRSEFLDDFFGLRDTEQTSKQRFDDIEAAVQRRTVDLVVCDFQRVIDDLSLTLAASGRSFGQLLFREQPARAPRYFQVVFLALYKLLIRERQEVADRTLLVQRMENSGISINVPEGGRWGAEDRDRAVDGAAGLFRAAFRPATAVDPATVHWITQLQNLLSQSYTEQSSYDFKQGFTRLDASKSFDESNFEKILQTCVGISNLRRGAKGYVLVGVADSSRTAERVREVYGVDPRSYQTFHVVGVEHEAQALGKSLDQFFQLIIEKVKSSEVSSDLRGFLARNLKSVRYHDKTVYVFEVEAQELPSSFKNVYFVRHGSQLDEVPAGDLPGLFQRFILGK